MGKGGMEDIVDVGGAGKSGNMANANPASCSVCNKPPIIFLYYANKHLCEQHFIRMFDKRFRKTIRERKMLRKGDRVAVALSGGKDSCVLLHGLSEIKKSIPLELVAITIDEGIAGYRSKTLEIARAECERLGIEHIVLSAKKEAKRSMDEIAKSDPENIPCSYCGVLRRHLLNQGAREANANKLATGHNLDDIAQTVFMNIMRNEPMRLARFSTPIVRDPKFIARIRPLLKTPEREVAIYAMVKGIELENIECPYARFAFRSHVRKMLNETEEKYPGTKFKVVNSFLEMEDALWTKYSKSAAALIFCKSCGEPSSNELCMFCKKIMGQ